MKILSLLEWDIETAWEANLAGKINDVKWVKYARRKDRIAITFDEFKAEQGVQIAQELRLRGGKIIRISGGPEQNPYRAVGKLLFHYPEWHPFLLTNDGICIISDVRVQSCHIYTPEQFHQRIDPLGAEQFTQYLEKRKRRPYHRRKRRVRLPPPEQGKLEP